MRIVAGALRGRTLVAPKGHSTRPTADRARQALFDVLEHAPWSRGLDGHRVVDLFAGSGALGLEALSRGAARCLFVDDDPAAIQAITDNVEALKLDGRARVRRANGVRIGAMGAADGPVFDLAFIDPPYRKGLAEPALRALSAGGWLAAGAIAVVEGAAEDPRPEIPGYLTQDVRSWGAARVHFLRVVSADEPPGIEATKGVRNWR
ncbi:MAG TPA: 16S rRNA (guanine(966)-N(2))-methyltransferase RsmD [Caulobacteraceae bacterium]|nr:16S rRNA (guanine(966)-N(2))-methyltransferase RsmD [Caulobacteraceae bacterium]